ncbi:MAG: hypothetical protein JSR60_07385 [Proteobacteria bacterium]|nr:hypothetical protein [Pseudomonadota bacterium]
MRKLILALALLLSSFPASAEEPSRQASLAALLESSAPPPEGFVRQKLDITDGLIFMPKGWFYRSGATASGWMWTLSKEDSATTPYRTGMRIQMFLGLSKDGAPAGEALANSILLQLRGEAKSVLNACTPAPFGVFTRNCLETIETSSAAPGVTFHVQYTAFWTPTMLVITTFGAPVEDWASLKGTAETMMAFRLIGPNFEKSSAP